MIFVGKEMLILTKRNFNVKRGEIKDQNVSTEEDIVQKLGGKEMEPQELFEEYFQVVTYESTSFRGSAPFDQALISELQIPSCTLEEWNNLPLLQQIFEYHLKKRTKSDVNWMGFIENWKNQQSKIIELRTSLMHLYGSEYQMKSREFCAWNQCLGIRVV
ncbi:hypothetical protein RhiirA4_510181 [Rhizophagus irregularis]|uniref:Uncharacterized protein n=1 Tax=Rhizophagus irregularis TaxID=588596 RepID=A0A2I1FVG2_9GLOM|nr:hypothetical protein RhiirA4_510181 [Rhizophagus irregularis]